MVSGQGENLSSMYIEEHAIGREQDQVCGNRKQCRARVEGGRDGDDDIAGGVILGKVFGGVWGRMGRGVRSLEAKGHKLIGIVNE